MATDVYDSIVEWTEWAQKDENQRFDIALFKVWINFEKFISELFVNYAIGRESETGYKPILKLQFQDETQLNAFLRGDRTFVDYQGKIKNLSKHIFKDDPFDLAIFSDSNNYNAYNRIFSIRNYVAHESGEARTKYVKVCLGGNEDKYITPNEYLKKINMHLEHFKSDLRYGCFRALGRNLHTSLCAQRAPDDSARVFGLLVVT